jgi:two-component system, sensor histidine kinase and response regulator
MFKSISSIFVQNSVFLKNNNPEGFKTKIFSTLCYLALFILILRVSMFLSFNINNFHWIDFSINFAPIVVVVLAIIFSKNNNTKTGKFILFCILPIQTLIICITQKENTISILFLIYAVSSLIFYENKWSIIASFLNNFVCYFIGQLYFLNISSTGINAKEIFFLTTNALLCFGIILYLLFYLKNTIKFYLKRVDNDNNVLAEINTDLMQMHNELVAKNNRLVVERTEIDINNKQLSKIFSIIAHDLKSPLVSVRNILNYAKDDVNTKSQISEYIPDISKTVNNTVTLLDNLLVWSRSQTQNELRQEVIHLKASFDEIIDLYGLALKSKNIIIEIENPLNALISFNKPMLHTILRNLISNAVKFTPLNGKIKIVAVPVHNSIKIQICNEVINVTDDTIEKLNDSADLLQLGTAGENGSGFGLVVTKDFLKSNNTELAFYQKNNKIIVAEFFAKPFKSTNVKTMYNSDKKKYSLAFG